jgi:hypothetical protein
MTDIYLAIKSGNYRHDIITANENIQKSLDIAKMWMKEEKDKYHEVEIVHIQLPFTQETTVGFVKWYKDTIHTYDEPTFVSLEMGEGR